jgi:hypothetical protein
MREFEPFDVKSADGSEILPVVRVLDMMLWEADFHPSMTRMIGEWIRQRGIIIRIMGLQEGDDGFDCSVRSWVPVNKRTFCPTSTRRRTDDLCRIFTAD